MPEQDQPRGFEHIRPVLIEPEVASVLELATEYQSELDEHPEMSEDRRNEIVHDLDSHWPHGEEVVYVSGVMRGPAYDIVESDEEGSDSRYTVMTKLRDDNNLEYEEYRAEDLALISRGFIIEPEPVFVGGHHIMDRQVVRLFFSRNHTLAIPDREEPYSLNDCVTCTPDQVALEFARDSPALCEAICDDYFPDATKLVRELIDDETLTTAEKIILLQDLELRHEPYITSREIQALSVFATESVGVAYENMPYYMSLEKNTGAYSTDNFGMEGVAVFEEQTYLVLISAVQARQKVVLTQRGEGQYCFTPQDSLLELRLVIRLLGPDSTYDGEEVEVCARDVRELRNVRDTIRLMNTYPDDTEDEQPHNEISG